MAKVTLSDLKNEGLLPRTIKNPKGGEFDDNTVVVITPLNNQTVYDIATPDELSHKFITTSNSTGNTYKYKNGAYRFIGPNPNNWIEFGSIGSTPIIWRIIKKDNEGIQLIYEGLKNGPNAPTGDGKMSIGETNTFSWDSTNTNEWERPATLKAKLQEWYNTLTINEESVKPIKWCIGASGEGINYSDEYVPIEHYLETECIDGTYNGKTYKGKTNEESAVGLIRASDYLSASNHERCVGSYWYIEGTSSEFNGNGTYCGRVVNETGRTNYLWKSYSWCTATARSTASRVWRVNTGGSIVHDSPSTGLPVRPVINLKYDVLYDDGEGTLAEPYKIK